MVYKKNFPPDKVELKWKGLYTVSKVVDENIVWIE